MTQRLNVALTKGVFALQAEDANSDAFFAKLRSPKVTEIYLRTDGSGASLQAIQDLRGDRLFAHPRQIYMGSLPRYRAKYYTQRTEPDPGWMYLFDEDGLRNWKASFIYDRLVSLSLFDARNPDRTKALVGESKINCFIIAQKIWNVYETLGRTLSFPAMALDRLSRATYYLHPDRMDIDKVREIAHLPSLEYNAATMTISLSFCERFDTISLISLGKLFDIILPQMQGLKHRHIGILAAFAETPYTQKVTREVVLNYGELGMELALLDRWGKVHEILPDDPIPAQPLLDYVANTQAEDRDVLCVTEYGDFHNIVTNHPLRFVRTDYECYTDGSLHASSDSVDTGSEVDGTVEDTGA